jgi:glycopeptide antibiotics resistance protein
MTQAWRTFGDLAPLLIVTALVTLIVTWRVVRRASNRGGPTRLEVLDAVARVWTVAAVIAVVLIVLRPIGGSGSVTGVNLVPFRSLVDLVNNSVDASVAVRNIAGNVLLFIPIGLTFGLVLRKHRHMILAATLAGLATSLVMEVVQLVFALGRVVDIDDLILNVIGTWIGALIAALALRLMDRPRESQGDRASTW